jgi:hypothetical protein
MTTYLHREDRLGIFVPFMPALRRADEQTRQLCYQAQENYSAGYITAATFTARVAALLGLPS